MNKFILASASPRRRTLLNHLNIPFEVQIAAVDEDSIADVNPLQNVQKRAELKAQGVFVHTQEPLTVLAADTIVTLGQHILNKPADGAEARYMLAQLRGRVHQVHTAITLRHLPSGELLSAVDTADVRMRAYTDDEIDAYIATGDPFDKAGSYAIQHKQFRPVASLNGCYLTVMGLSLCKLITMVQTCSTPVTVSSHLLQKLHQGHPCPILDTLNL